MYLYIYIYIYILRLAGRVSRMRQDTKIYVTIQWIQQLIISNLNTGAQPSFAPIISPR